MFGKIEHVSDPYDRKREFFMKDLKLHYSKLQDKPFNGMVGSKSTFFTGKE